MQRIPAGADRLVVVMSDIEMGSGGILDDFPHSDWLADLLRTYSAPPYDELAVDIVFDGDTFDLLKTQVDGTHPRHVTEAIALRKLAAIQAAHGAFFTGVHDFLVGASAPRRVHFIVGNHDAELVFPAVQRAITEAVGAKGVWFPGFRVDIGDLRVEHGNQNDPMFEVDEYAPFTRFGGEEILDLPWGTVAILDVMMPLQSVLFALDRVKPRPPVFELLPECQVVLSNAFWQYWTRDYLRGLVGRNDPTRKASWAMLREVVYRFTTFDPDTSGSNAYRDLLRADDRIRLVVVGHHHRPSVWTWGDSKLMELGCLRDEWALDRHGALTGPLNKVYGEVFLRDQRVVRSTLVEVEGPPSPPGHVPGSILELRQPLLDLLGPGTSSAPLTGVEPDPEKGRG